MSSSVGSGFVDFNSPLAFYSTKPSNREQREKRSTRLPFRHYMRSSSSSEAKCNEIFATSSDARSPERSNNAHCPLSSVSSTECCCREQRLNLACQNNVVLSAQCAFKESMIHQILQFILHFRILPRSSSLREPRGPSLKGVFCLMRFALVTLVSKSKGWCEKKKTR